MNKEKIKTGVWSAIGGGIITMIIGFSWGGWVSGKTAIDMSEETARIAIIERLTPICVGLANQDVEKTATLETLKEANSWDRGKIIMDHGWATIPFENEPDSSVADNCSEKLIKGI